MNGKRGIIEVPISSETLIELTILMATSSEVSTCEPENGDKNKHKVSQKNHLKFKYFKELKEKTENF